jgi:NCS1 family nucleobase:cation symporter-1
LDSQPTGAADTTAHKKFSIEQHGFDFIPDAERTMTLRQANLFWAGTNANLFPVALGAVGHGLGLSLWQAGLAAVIGNLLFSYVAYAAAAGPRAGVPTMVFTRSAFGVRGNNPNIALTWICSVAFEAINILFGAYALLAFLPSVGIPQPGPVAKVVCTFVVLLLSASVAVLGHATMVYLQRFFTIALSICLILTFAFTVGGSQWAADGVQLSHGAAWAALFVAASVNASGPISFLYNAPEWFRYLPATTPHRKLFWNLFFSGGVTATFLGILGAVLASQVDLSNPVAAIKPLIPGWVFFLFVVAAVGGTIAAHIPTYYSSGLTLRALGVPLRRYQATLLDCVVSTAVVLVVLFNDSFLTALNDFVAFLVVWLGPFAGVWITDAILRRWQWDPVALHAAQQQEAGRYWGTAGWNVPGWIALLVGIAISLLTVHAPVYQGWISARLDGADLSWLLGFWISALVYYALSRKRIQARTLSSHDDIDPVRLTASTGDVATEGQEHDKMA